MKYYVWRNGYREGFCALGALEKVPNDQEISKGQSRANGFPTDAFYKMRADFPKDVRVPDNVYTMIHFVVSARLRSILAPDLGASQVEFLPVRIKDHQDRVVDGEHFIVNPLDVLDAIDVAASTGEYNDLDPTQLCMVEQLVLKPVPENVVLFRPHNWTRLLLLREDLVAKLKAAKLDGLSFSDPEDFGG